METATKDGQECWPISRLQALLFGFISVYVTSLLWTQLPNLRGVILVTVGCLSLALCTRLYRKTRLFLCLIGALVGLFWASVISHWYTTWQREGIDFQQTVVISGRVTQIRSFTDRVALSLTVYTLNDVNFMLPRKMRLNWYVAAPGVNIGDQLQLRAILKPPHGLANPSGFDHARWLLAQNIAATGYVNTHYAVSIRPSKLSFRTQLRDRLAALNLLNNAWVLALTMGDREDLEPSDWQLLQDTGVAHLFAISGLHLGIIAGFCFLFWRCFLAMLALTMHSQRMLKRIGCIPLQPIGYMVCAVTCFGYAYLSGWQLPVQRAYLALAVTLIFASYRWRIHAVSIVMLVLGLILVFSPYSIYSSSLWLSFVAVVAVLLLHWRYHPWGHNWRSRLLVLLKLQVMLTLLSLPLVVTYFHTLSIITIVANLLFVPWVSFVLLPASLMALLVFILAPDWGTVLFVAVDQLFAVSLIVLKQLHALPFAAIKDVYWSPLIILSLGLAVFIWVLPTFTWQRRLSGLLCLPLLLHLSGIRADNQHWYVHVFDVGQGTAIAVSQGKRVMLYDTGPAFASGLTAAQHVILPFFAAQGWTEIDHLIISHFDIDHAGGRTIVEDELTVNDYIEPTNCAGKSAQQWGKLTLTFLWPLRAERQQRQLSDNAQSCVVKISDGQHSILLPGDIDRWVETELVKRAAAVSNQFTNLNANILIAPHHGSNTSSTYAFIGAVDPEHVVYTTGYLNRWKFPHRRVEQRYKNMAVTAWNTGSSGYHKITIPFCNGRGSARQDAQNDCPNSVTIASYNHTLKPRWYRHRD